MKREGLASTGAGKATTYNGVLMKKDLKKLVLASFFDSTIKLNFGVNALSHLTTRIGAHRQTFHRDKPVKICPDELRFHTQLVQASLIIAGPFGCGLYLFPGSHRPEYVYQDSRVSWNAEEECYTLTTVFNEKPRAVLKSIYVWSEPGTTLLFSGFLVHCGTGNDGTGNGDSGYPRLFAYVVAPHTEAHPNKLVGDQSITEDSSATRMAALSRR